IRRGFEETREKYLARYGSARETMGELRFEILDVRALGSCSDAAIVLGRWQLTETPEAGSGVFSVILERQGESWRIVHDHTSADPPTPWPSMLGRGEAALDVWWRGAVAPRQRRAGAAARVGSRAGPRAAGSPADGHLFVDLPGLVGAGLGSAGG